MKRAIRSCCGIINISSWADFYKLVTTILSRETLQIVALGYASRTLPSFRGRHFQNCHKKKYHKSRELFHSALISSLPTMKSSAEVDHFITSLICTVGRRTNNFYAFEKGRLRRSFLDTCNCFRFGALRETTKSRSMTNHPVSLSRATIGSRSSKLDAAMVSPQPQIG
jgi:hypothetical protein